MAAPKRRPLKHHIQQSLTFRTWGGRRQGAGRPVPRGRRASERHQERPAIDARHPLHVTLRVVQAVRPLRRSLAYHAFRYAMVTALVKHVDFRIVHISFQRTHVHLIVEAATKEALAKGMQGFQISAARHLNGAITKETGVKRAGTVFPDRYNARALTSPRAVRHALNYVLNNWRRHGEDRNNKTRLVDPYSSGVNFAGWQELEDSPFLFQVPEGFSRLTTAVAHTWLLAKGWTRHGSIGARERPGPDAKRPEAGGRTVG